MYSDIDSVQCMYTGAVHVVVHVQGLRVPLYPGCGMHGCGLVRNGSVEWEQVSTQEPDKYCTWHSLFSSGKTNHHTKQSVASIPIKE